MMPRPQGRGISLWRLRFLLSFRFVPLFRGVALTLFDDRERAFELKYVHDLETAFRMRVVAMRMLAQWAADRMGLKGAEADAYVARHASAVTERTGPADLAQRIRNDLAVQNIDVSEREMHLAYDAFCADALKRLKTLPDEPEPGMVRLRH